MEEIVKQIPMWLDIEKCFTKMNENGDLVDGVGIEMTELNPIEVEKTTEERLRGETKSSQEERLEHDGLVGLVGREILTYGRPPSCGHLVWQHAVPYEVLQPLLG